MIDVGPEVIAISGNLLVTVAILASFYLKTKLGIFYL